jgi:hypothetical protein
MANEPETWTPYSVERERLRDEGDPAAIYCPEEMAIAQEAAYRCGVADTEVKPRDTYEEGIAEGRKLAWDSIKLAWDSIKLSFDPLTVGAERGEVIQNGRSFEMKYNQAIAANAAADKSYPLGYVDGWDAAINSPEVQAVVDALNLIIPYLEDEWGGSRGCLMPTCQAPYDGHHATECPIGIAVAARDGYQARFPRRNES